MEIQSMFPKLSLLTFLICKPIYFLLATPVIAATSSVVDIVSASWILFWLFLGDLVTGTLASYFVWKKKPGKKDKWFFGRGEGFSSDKFKKCFVKGIIYAAFPLLVIKFQKTFLLKNVKYESISDAEIELATLTIVVFCAIELFSIVSENLPKCGVNIIKTLKDIIKEFLGFKNNITKEE